MVKSKTVIVNESETDSFKHFIEFQGLYKVRNRMYRVIINSKPYVGGSPEFCSFCKDVDSGATLWDNENAQIKSKSKSSLEETKEVLKQELKVYLDMFEKMGN